MLAVSIVDMEEVIECGRLPPSFGQSHGLHCTCL
jgi:hypothetical protein